MGEVCAEHGAANATVAHIVARSGVSRRTFYELFDDREDCLLAAVEEALSRAAKHVLSAYDAPGHWQERMRAALLALLEFLDDEPYLGRLLIVETLSGSGQALRRRQEVLTAAIAAVELGRAEAKDPGPPQLTAEGVVGAALSVLHARLLDPGHSPLRELAGQLMSMIVLPYLGAGAARRELARPVSPPHDRRRVPPANPLRTLEMRLTYRTVQVLGAVAATPGSSNREIGEAAEIHDQGQMSKLLTRLEKLGLIENTGAGATRGAPNAWTLTAAGQDVHQTFARREGAPQLA
jgi:AcrR family transcriptional regulator/DNA-binding MarR family transcriptional regulator